MRRTVALSSTNFINERCRYAKIARLWHATLKISAVKTLSVQRISAITLELSN